MGVSLVDDQNNLRDVMQVYTEVGERIKNISDSERIAVVEGLAGKYHISRMQALLDDLGSADSMYKSMYESSKNSTGSAMDENEKYMKSLQARINLARVEVEKLALAFGDAFLTEGMIQGLKVFGQFLNGLASLTNAIGALPIVLGTAGAGLALLSTRFRTLMITLGEASIAYTKMGISAARASAVSVPPLITQTTATNAMSTSAILAGTSVQRLGVSTAVTTTSARALAAPMTAAAVSTQALGRAALTASVGTSAAATSTATAGAAARTATGGFLAAAAGMRGMLLSAGLIGVAFVAIGAVTEALMSKQQKHRELEERIASENKQLAESYKTNGDEISKLADKYAELDGKVSEGDWSNDNMKEYVTVQNELAELLPSLKKGEDDHGNAILGNAGVIQQRVSLLQQQAEMQERVNAAKAKEEAAEEYNVALDSKKTATGEMDDFKFESRADSRGRGGQIADYLDVGSIENAKQLAAAIETLTNAKTRMAEEDAVANAGKIGAIDRELEYYMTQQQAYTNLKLQIEMADSAILNSSIKKTEAVLAQNEKIKSSSRSLADSFQLTASEVITDTGQMTTVLNNFSTALENPTSIQALEKYGNSFETLKRKQAEGLSTESLERYAEDVRTNLNEVQRDFMQLAENEGITLKTDPTAYNQLLGVFKTLNPQIDTLAMSTDDLASSMGISQDAASALLAEAASMGDGADMASAAIDEETDSVYALKDSIDLMAGVNQQFIDDSDQLIWMIGHQTSLLASLTEGTYAHSDAEATLNSMKEQMISLYPHLFEADATAIALTDDKISAVAAEVEANDILRAAYSASRDGKLTSEQESTLANLANTNARIKNINAEILALDALAQAYKAFAANSINTANEFRLANEKQAELSGTSNAELESHAQDAEIRARKFNGFAVTQQQASAGLQAQLADETAVRTGYTDILKKVPEVLDRGTTAANKNASAGRKAAEADKKGAEAADKKTKAEKEKEKAEEESYKTITENNEAIEESIYITNEYEKAIEKLTLAIQKQQSITQKFPTYSNAYTRSLKAEIKLQEQKVKLLNDQSKSLQDQIKSGKIIRYGTSTVTTAPSTTTTSTVRELNGWEGSITSGYGMRRHPITGQYKMHDGIDIAGSTGDRLDTNVNGKVLWAGDKGNGLGKYVMVQAENGIKHIFAHLSKVAVKVGDKVATGMKLGEIGSTGASTGSHLHYEVRNQNNQSVNPLNYLNAAKEGQTVYSNTTVDSASSGSSGSSGVYAGKYAKEINSAAKSFGVSADLIAAMIKQESNFNARAVSGAGAKGLMQLMPGTARELGVKDPFNVQQNINGGTKYIAQQLKSFGGDITKALAAYNAGPGNVRKYGGTPPFKETQQYVKKVMENFKAYSGKVASSQSIIDTTSSLTPGSSTTSVFKDEAATKEAIEDAQSQILDINGELISVNDYIDQLQTDIVQGQISRFQNERDMQDRSLVHVEKDMALLDSTSLKYIDTLGNVQKHLDEKQRLNNEELRYLNKMIASNKLNAAATEELRIRSAELKLEIKDLNMALADVIMNGFSAHMGRFGEAMSDLQYLMEISKSYSSTLFGADPRIGKELAKQVHLMEHQQDLLKRQKARAEDALKNTKLTADQHKEIEATLQGINTEYWTLENSIREVNATVADDVIAQMKEAYAKQKEMALKAIEDERTAYQKLVDDKLKMLDEQAEKEDFLADQKDKQEDRTELQSKIDLLSLDDSQFAKAEKAKLQEELDALDKDYANFMKEKEREDRRNSLEEELENKEEELSKKTESTEKYWEDIINNERKFAKDRENIMKGETTAYVLELERLRKWTKTNMNDIGKSITLNLLDKLDEANMKLKNVSTLNDSDASLVNRNNRDGNSVEWEKYYREKDEKYNSKERKTKAALNLRSGAGVKNKSMMVIPKGKTVEFLDVKTKGGWAKVKYDGKTGYVDAKQLTKFETGGLKLAHLKLFELLETPKALLTTA